MCDGSDGNKQDSLLYIVAPVGISLTEGLSEFAQVKLQEGKKMGNTLGNRQITNMDLR